MQLDNNSQYLESRIGWVSTASLHSNFLTISCSHSGLRAVRFHLLVWTILYVLTIHRSTYLNILTRASAVIVGLSQICAVPLSYTTFTVVCSVTWPLNGSEAEGDLAFGV